LKLTILPLHRIRQFAKARKEISAGKRRFVSQFQAGERISLLA